MSNIRSVHHILTLGSDFLDFDLEPVFGDSHVWSLMGNFNNVEKHLHQCSCIKSSSKLLQYTSGITHCAMCLLLCVLGEGQRTVIKLKLDRMADSVSGQSVIDPKGYLTDLGNMGISSSSEISDIKKARLLLKSVITTNPHHGPGWIAAARLEERAGKLQVGKVQR